jgi:putative oxidoreductase
VVVWTLRVLLALLFVYLGVAKFGDSRVWTEIFEQIGFGQWFRYVTGAVEVTGGLLLLVPKATLPAVTMLACTMVGALVTHVFVIGVGRPSVMVLLLLLLLLTVARTHRLQSRRRQLIAG